MKKYSKKLIMSFLASTFGAVTSLSVLFPLLNSTNTSQITNISNTNQATESTSFILSETNEQNANISTTKWPCDIFRKYNHCSWLIWKQNVRSWFS